LSPCSYVDFEVHRGALYCCAYILRHRLYFGTFVLGLCYSRGYVRLQGLEKLVVFGWTISYVFCCRLCMLLVMLVYCSFLLSLLVLLSLFREHVLFFGCIRLFKGVWFLCSLVCTCLYILTYWFPALFHFLIYTITYI